MSRVAFEVAGVGDVVAEVDESTTTEEVSQALGLAPSLQDLSLSDAGFRVGSTWGQVPAGERDADLRLEVVGGPFAGQVIELPRGATISVGSSSRMLLWIADPGVAEFHASLVVAPDKGSVQLVPQPGCVAAVDGALVEEPVVVGPGTLFQLGSSLFRVGYPLPGDGDVSGEGVGPGRLGFNRGSRVRREPERPTVRLPGDKPSERVSNSVSWISAIVPVVMGVTMALLFKQPRMLMFAFFSPVMVIGSYFAQRKTSKRSGRQTVETWRADVAAARGSIRRYGAEQRAALWDELADPVRCVDMAEGPSARLWERRMGDDDALRVRVGVGVVDLDIGLEGASAKRDGIANKVGVAPCPVAVDLSAGVVGIAGPREVTASVARAMIASLCAARSPRDLRLVVLCEDDALVWEWMRWLPHVSDEVAWAGIGNTASSRAARLRELVGLIEAREREASSGGVLGGKSRWAQDVVVVVDQSRVFRMLPGMATVLERGPRVGVCVLALDTEQARLPQECVSDVVVQRGSTTEATVASREQRVDGVLLDGFGLGLAERFARSLAPIVHVAGVGDDNLLPDAVRLVDLLGIDLDAPDPGGLAARWRTAPRCTSVGVGAGPGGSLFSIDLAIDGPHALVAGTTGAGKSELLQGLIVSLALANRPDALNFVLIDYKGGSAFADCANLPHVVGMVTNLDGRGTERALESLDAELKRREQVLAELGAKDADAAWARNPREASARGLARLVLVIDEFAELKSELEDFIKGLVRIARVGRSLGVHLILATQRPSGAITPEMQSNTNLRIALRVTDKADSTDVLGSAEAASISPTTPGRAFVRRGVGSAPAQFQAGRVAGQRPGVANAARRPVRVVSRAWEEIGEPIDYPPLATGPVDHDDTDLRALVNLVNAATEQLGLARSKSPWLEPLPNVVQVNKVPGVARGQVVLGLEDIPSRQAQEALIWDPRTDSHLALIGGARSGRTSMLRTMAAQLATWYGPKDLHLYALDYGNGGLAPLADLPHTGAVITPLEQGRSSRFWDRLAEEMNGRQALLARNGFGSIGEQQRAQPEAALSYVVVLIDNWDRLVAEAPDAVAFREQTRRFLREAPALGVRFVVAGDRALISDTIRGFIPTTFCLPLASRDDYQDSAIGLKVTELPEVIPPGRLLMGKPTREAQAALLPGPTDGESQARTLAVIVRKMAAHWAGQMDEPSAQGPFKVDVLPGFITAAQANLLPPFEDCPADGVTLGVGGDVLGRVTADWSHDWLVAGPRKSGRSTTLLRAVEQAIAAGHLGVLVIAPRPSLLREYAEQVGLALVSDVNMDGDEFSRLLIRVCERAGEGEGLVTATVVIDDHDAVADSLVEKALMASGRSLTIWLATTLAGAGGYTGVVKAVRDAEFGFLLSPQAPGIGQNVFSSQIPAELVGRANAGRAVWFDGQDYRLVQLVG